ncbi:hypothetical protein TUBRATIS_22290 [Tubulinosema ratisbonensis]|uniref:Uncharacterized protein n=1 Tax=Tubulinosema ratisbonensis TaxID=291195 RepID=A0A437AJM9_9MICR|nr:hypothetical protein TUBRATIS_22290 [Tubulinosema ratisbonensis]
MQNIIIPEVGNNENLINLNNVTHPINDTTPDTEIKATRKRRNLLFNGLEILFNLFNYDFLNNYCLIYKRKVTLAILLITFFINLILVIISSIPFYYYHDIHFFTLTISNLLFITVRNICFWKRLYDFAGSINIAIYLLNLWFYIWINYLSLFILTKIDSFLTIIILVCVLVHNFHVVTVLFEKILYFYWIFLFFINISLFITLILKYFCLIENFFYFIMNVFHLYFSIISVIMYKKPYFYSDPIIYTTFLVYYYTLFVINEYKIVKLIEI